MNELKSYFQNNTKRVISKWDHYFDIYERYFSKYRGKEIVILEIGVFQGGSLQMWKQYFGEKAMIYGIDIDPKCKSFEEENIEIFIGSQSDVKFLEQVKSKIPLIDILIDDGGHEMNQQIITFKELFSHIKDNGVYLCEDLHTSYWLDYGGGYLRKGTFIEFSKKLIDQLNAFHSHQKNLEIDGFTKSAYSLHYYDSILVIEKKQVTSPFDSSTGNLRIDDILLPRTKFQKANYKILRQINMILRKLKLRSIFTNLLLKNR